MAPADPPAPVPDDAPPAPVPDDAPPAPVPDDKDWTWTLARPCPDCGYDAATVDRDDLSGLILDATARMGVALRRPDAVRRPAPTTWSVLEYAAHVRDVCEVFEGRLELMLGASAVDASGDPETVRFPNWDQDQTALTKRYWTESPREVESQLAAAAASLANAFARVEQDQWSRTGLRSNGSQFTVDSLGRYLLHDLVHHVHDVDG